MKRFNILFAALAIAACGGNGGAPRIQIFSAGQPSIVHGQSTELLFVVDSATTLNITPDVGSVTGKSAVTVSPEITTTYTLHAERDGKSSTATATVNVGNGAPARFVLDGVPTEIGVDTPTTLTITVKNAFGNTVTDYAGTVHIVLTDGAAPVATDVRFTPSMHGTADVPLVFFTDGPQSIIVSDAAIPALTTSAAIQVRNGGATGYSLSPLPLSAVAGEPLPLTITAVDKHGNVVKDYRGAAHVSSTEPTDRLPADGTFDRGVRTVSLAFVTAVQHLATVKEVGGTITANTSSVDVVSGDAVNLTATGTATVAGAATSTDVAVLDTFGNAVRSFAGTISFTSTDAQASLPTSFTFGPADAGRHTFPVTLKTSGLQTVTASDAAHSLSGTGGFSVSPAAATVCSVLDLPASAAAGAQLGLRVAVKDAFGNAATGYAGTITLSSNDARAVLSGPATFSAPDNGTRAFSAQFRTAGSETIAASDAASSISCQALVSILPGAPLFAVTFPGAEAWAGTGVVATVKAQDGFGNAIAFAGTIALTSSDAAAVLPANVTLNGTEGGVASVNVTFNSVGLQTLTATDAAAAATTGSGTQTVHGFVYTDPASGGKVRLVRNASSTASVVQLDLVSNATLFAVSAGGINIRNGVFAAGMNLPLDATKVSPGANLITTTAPAGSSGALNLATGTAGSPRAIAAALNPATSVLYSGVSQKRIANNGAGLGDASLRPFPGAASYYYSLTLRLVPGAAPGTVFDGQNLGAKFHAAVRDHSGTDLFQNADFALGMLEIR
jgi:hypothetical protein